MNRSKRDRWPPYKPGRHVLVLRHHRFERPWQGLLLEWRPHSYKWYARVNYVQDDGVEVTRWMPASRLYPLDVDPNVVESDRAVWPPEARQRW